MNAESSHEHRRACGAKTRPGHLCKLPPTPGRTRCRFHGGKTLLGAASGTYRTGKYSTVLPVKLQQRYEAARQDRDLLSLREEIAVVDARLADAYTRLDTGESGALWKQLAKAERELRVAIQANERQGMLLAITSIRDCIQHGAADAEASREVRDLEDHRRKLVETEQRLLLMRQQTLSVEQLQTLLGVLIETIRRHVTAHSPQEQARRILAGICADVQRYEVLEGAPDGARLN